MSQPTSRTAPPDTDRFDIYHDIHKGLRACLFATQAAVARADLQDAAEVDTAVSALHEMLDFCTGHVVHENEFVHTAMEARRPGSAEATAADHPGHEAEIAELRRLCDAFGRGKLMAERRALWNALQRKLAQFIGENLTHMEVEESHNNAVLQSAYSDAELIELHDRLVASLQPAELAMNMRWMLIGLAHEERLRLLQAVQADAPAPVLDVMLNIARDNLSGRDWEKLAAGLAQPLAA
jgi:hypothetical protein